MSDAIVAEPPGHRPLTLDLFRPPGAPPLLLVHGDADPIVVPVGQSRELYERLTAVGAPAELRVVPGADHCFAGADLPPLVDEGLSFLDRALDHHRDAR